MAKYGPEGGCKAEEVTSEELPPRRQQVPFTETIYEQARADFKGLQHAIGFMRLWRAWPDHRAPAECFRMILRPGSVNKRVIDKIKEGVGYQEDKTNIQTHKFRNGGTKNNHAK